LGAYREGNVQTLEIREYSDRLRLESTRIARMLMLGDDKGETVVVEQKQLTAPLTMDSLMGEGANPPRGVGRCLKLPPPNCISNLGSSHCFHIGDDND